MRGRASTTPSLLTQLGLIMQLFLGLTGPSIDLVACVVTIVVSTVAASHFGFLPLSSCYVYTFLAMLLTFFLMKPVVPATFVCGGDDTHIEALNAAHLGFVPQLPKECEGGRFPLRSSTVGGAVRVIAL